MEDFIEQNEYRSQIASLNREVQNLTEKLQQKEHINKFNPFDNPTEYRDFSGNYEKIVPNIEAVGYELPLEPTYAERKKIKRFYSIGGWCMLLQFALSTGGATLIMLLIMVILKKMNPETNPTIIEEYMKSSSIFVSLNMFIYLICNVFTAFLGMKKAEIKPRSLIKTRNFNFGLAVQYCMSALFIWVVAIYLSTGINDIFTKYGYNTIIDQSDIGKTTLASIIMNIYTCIVAPITEELLFRGMLLKVFSKANQRFAIFTTAVFFGLAHGNIPQFMLAFFMGIFLAHITMKHNSIIPAIIVHMFINTFSTMFSFLESSGNTVQQISIVMLFALAVLGLIMFLVFYGENRLPLTTPKQATRGFDIAVCSFPLSISFIVQTLYMMYVLFKNG